ncbi:MAG: hypothetical protein JST31_00115 [Actinobacteria bacterium]|nr:hypothetical protein [Actinomycetota bacterium]
MDRLGDAERNLKESEAEFSAAAEDFVARPQFVSLLAFAAGNLAATTRIATDVFDLALRNLRLAGRQDVVSLAKQLGRTEDKLERVLQEIEGLRAEAGRAAAARAESPTVERLEPRARKSRPQRSPDPDRQASTE